MLVLRLGGHDRSLVAADANLIRGNASWSVLGPRDVYRRWFFGGRDRESHQTVDGLETVFTMPRPESYLGFEQVLVSPFGQGGGGQVQSSIRKNLVSIGCVGTLESSRTGLNSAPWFEYSSPEFHDGQLGMTILSACNKIDWPRTRLISARLSVTGECHAS